jgi:hypothetical protein
MEPLDASVYSVPGELWLLAVPRSLSLMVAPQAYLRPELL